MKGEKHNESYQTLHQPVHLHYIVETSPVHIMYKSINALK